MARRLLAVLMTLSLAGCGAGRQTAGSKDKSKGDRTLISHSEGVEPLWIQQCPAQTEHLLPFCGEAIRQAGQKMACTAAYADALGKLRRMIGQKVDAKLAPDGQGGYRFEIQGAESDPVTIRGAWEDQRWYEEYDGPDGRTYDCYVMLAYPALEYNNLIGMAREAAAERAVKAEELHREGKDLASQGRHAEAVTLFKRARTLLAGLKEPVVTPDGLNSSLLAEQVVADLRTSGEEAGKAAKTALVVIRLLIDGQPRPRAKVTRSVRNQVKTCLVKHGVRIRPGGLPLEMVDAVLSGDRQAAARAAADKGAGMLLIIDIESDFDQKDKNNIFYANARGAFRLIRTNDGRELAAVDLGPEEGSLPAEHKSRLDTVELAAEKLCKRHLLKAVRNAVGKI